MKSKALPLIEQAETLRASIASDRQLDARVSALQRWQSGRIAATYADCARDKRYTQALRFFIEDLYGPNESLQEARDADLKKVLHQWERVLPARAHEALLFALELEMLTLSLDKAVAECLDSNLIDENSYARAYRRANRRKDRQRQIWLIVACGRALDRLVRLPAIGIALRLARAPARLAGLTWLQTFLERGYAAFATMNGAAELLRIIETRETAIMQRLLAGAANPFAIPPEPTQQQPRTQRPQ